MWQKKSVNLNAQLQQMQCELGVRGVGTEGLPTLKKKEPAPRMKNLRTWELPG